MTENEAKGLAILMKVHLTSPGRCCILIVIGHRTDGGIYAKGGGTVKAYYGKLLVPIHHPHLCPLSLQAR